MNAQESPPAGAPSEPLTPVDLLLPGAWRTSRKGRHAGADESPDAAPTVSTPPVVTRVVRPPSTLPLPLGDLLGPDAEDAPAGTAVDEPPVEAQPVEEAPVEEAAAAEPSDTGPAAAAPAEEPADTPAFWEQEVRVPIIREPSPVLGDLPAPVAEPLETVTEPFTAPVVGPVVAPVVAPVPVAGEVSAPPPPAAPTTAPQAVVPPRPPVEELFEIGGSAEPPATRRILARTAFVFGGALVAAGLAVPFLLGGLPGGNDTVTLAQTTASPSATASRDSVVTTYVPTVSGSVPVATPTAGPVERQPAVPTASATRRTTRPAASTSRTASRSSSPPAPTRTRPRPGPPSPQPTRPGQVFVDEAAYVGRPLDQVRRDLEALGVRVVDNPAFGTRKPRGEVVGLRPGGWVDPGSTVRVFFAW